MPPDLNHLIAADRQSREQAHLFRRPRIVTPLSPTRALVDGRPVINFASNNYLGFTHHPRLLAATIAAAQDSGVGSSAAPLITGHTHHHRAAEQSLARWKKTGAAVLLPSGYQANLAAVQTLAALGQQGGGGTRFLADKLCHASLIDAARAATVHSSAELRIFPHNHLPKLQRLLESAPADQLQVVLTESIFSMDGDAADLAGFVALKRQHPFVLLLDEAHASGVFGPAGSGYAAELGLSEFVDITIITLSKALGLSGGAVCASADFCSALHNLGRAYIFSTAIPPHTAAACSEALEIFKDEPEHQSRLRQLARRVRSEISNIQSSIRQTLETQSPVGQTFLSAQKNLPEEQTASRSTQSNEEDSPITSPQTKPEDSPIIPLILGEESTALAAADYLLASGLLVPAVRPPTVPKGASRLRITVSAAHTDEDLDRLLQALRGLPGSTTIAT